MTLTVSPLEVILEKKRFVGHSCLAKGKTTGFTRSKPHSVVLMLIMKPVTATPVFTWCKKHPAGRQPKQRGRKSRESMPEVGFFSSYEEPDFPTGQRDDGSEWPVLGSADLLGCWSQREPAVLLRVSPSCLLMAFPGQRKTETLFLHC